MCGVWAGVLERLPILWLLFLSVLSSPLGQSFVSWASQDCCLFYLRSSLWSSDLLCSLFAGFTLPCLLATAILDSYFLFYLPNTPNLNHHLHLYVTNSHSLCDDFPTNFEPKLGQP